MSGTQRRMGRKKGPHKRSKVPYTGESDRVHDSTA
jgi:hypothetical protein